MCPELPSPARSNPRSRAVHFRPGVSFSPVPNIMPRMRVDEVEAQCNIQAALFELRKINCPLCIMDERGSRGKVMPATERNPGRPQLVTGLLVALVEAV